MNSTESIEIILVVLLAAILFALIILITITYAFLKTNQSKQQQHSRDEKTFSKPGGNDQEPSASTAPTSNNPNIRKRKNAVAEDKRDFADEKNSNSTVGQLKNQSSPRLHSNLLATKVSTASQPTVNFQKPEIIEPVSETKLLPLLPDQSRVKLRQKSKNVLNGNKRVSFKNTKNVISQHHHSKSELSLASKTTEESNTLPVPNESKERSIDKRSSDMSKYSDDVGRSSMFSLNPEELSLTSSKTLHVEGRSRSSTYSHSDEAFCRQHISEKKESMNRNSNSETIFNFFTNLNELEKLQSQASVMVDKSASTEEDSGFTQARSQTPISLLETKHTLLTNAAATFSITGCTLKFEKQTFENTVLVKISYKYQNQVMTEEGLVITPEVHCYVDDNSKPNKHFSITLTSCYVNLSTSSLTTLEAQCHNDSTQKWEVLHCRIENSENNVINAVIMTQKFGRYRCILPPSELEYVGKNVIARLFLKLDDDILRHTFICFVMDDLRHLETQLSLEMWPPSLYKQVLKKHICLKFGCKLRINLSQESSVLTLCDDVFIEANQIWQSTLYQKFEFFCSKFELLAHPSTELVFFISDVINNETISEERRLLDVSSSETWSDFVQAALKPFVSKQEQYNTASSATLPRQRHTLSQSSDTSNSSYISISSMPVKNSPRDEFSSSQDQHHHSRSKRLNFSGKIKKFLPQRSSKKTK